MASVRKEVHTPCRDGRPVFPGFVPYVRRASPVLVHRSGWVDASDTYDDFADSFSRDNGQSWSEPRPALRSRESPEGRVRYAENACFFDAETERLLTFTSRSLSPRDRHDPDAVWEVVHDAYDPAAELWRGERPLGVSMPGGLAISFCFPILTSRGTLLIPACGKILGDDGTPVHHRGCWSPLYQAATVRGRRAADGTFAYSLGGIARIDPEASSRGLSENTLVELRDGRIAMVARGYNSMFPERPGYKWACFSSDDGASWSEPRPFGCDGGEPIESSSTGSALLRCARTRRLYWIGNLCIRGRRANGNWPRSPLVVAEVDEERFAIVRSSVAVIDEQAPGEPETVQHSNFRFYQDRQSGELVLFLTRFGERDAKEWKRADYYRYRVRLG